LKPFVHVWLRRLIGYPLIGCEFVLAPEIKQPAPSCFSVVTRRPHALLRACSS
jgi:hypothetical protein